MLLPPAFGAELCPSSQLATRTGTASCWARLEKPRICLSHQEWLAWLRSSGPLCGTWDGKWKLTGFPENDPTFSGKKKPLLRFNSTRLERQDESSLWRALAWRLIGEIERLREKVSELLAPNDPMGFFRSLVLNERVPDSPLDLLRHLGFVHLITASGIHLYAIGAWLFWSFCAVSAWLRIPVKIALPVARVAVFLTWSFAWVLSGARAGMLRPWIVIGLRRLAAWAGFRWRAWSPLLAALLLEAILALFRGGDDSAYGKWYYALAVGGGLLARKHWALALLSWIFAAIWEAWRLGLVSILTPLISWITVPLLSLLIYPALFFTVMLSAMGAELPISFLHVICSLGNVMVVSITRVAVSLPTLWVLSRQDLFMGLGVALIATAASIRFRSRAWAYGIAVAVALRLAMPTSASVEKNVADQVEQLDVGQGDSALVQQGPDFGMIDTGSALALSEGRWLELFAQRGALGLQWIGLTHLDEDHRGALEKLARLIPIGCVETSEAELSTPRGQELSRKMSALGMEMKNLESGCARVEVYRPSENALGKRKANQAMSAFLVTLRGGGFYLSAGDADRPQERRIAQWLRRAQGSVGPGPRILKISHHGSSTSSDPEFLRVVRPTETWISVGVGNAYGHPSAEVIDQIERLGTPIRRTDRDGALRIRAAGVRHR